MKGSNQMILSNDSVLEALDDYLKKHAGPGVDLQALSWGMRMYDGHERVHIEFEQTQPAKAQP